MILAARRPHIFTIPAAANFLPTLFRALADGTLVPDFASRDPIALSRVTVYLPTRRACRLAREAFLAALECETAILPRIVPLGDIDEDEFVFLDAANGSDTLDLKPPIGSFERRLLLAKLILAWAGSPAVAADGGAPLIARTPAAGLALADDLARLIDDITTRQVPWTELDKLVPSEFDRVWEHTLRFLKIAREAWPAILAERGRLDLATHRDLLIKRETDRLRRHEGPVIVAGSTGSMPATAELISAIATLPQGAVVLPGLDLDLDEESWQLLAGSKDTAPLAGHPQYAMQALLARLHVARRDVMVLGATDGPSRSLLASEALRPAESTDRWHQRLSASDHVGRISAALDDLSVIEAAHADEEALAIAIALRETLEDPGRTAALVTPDRALARRVVTALERWKIVAEDTGGDPLGTTTAGTLARLAAAVALNGLPPVPLLALLKHPHLRLGREPGGWRVAISALERAVLRGSRPNAGSAGLAHALATMRSEWEKLQRREISEIFYSDSRGMLTAPQLNEAAALVAALTKALAPLEQFRSRPKAAFAEIAAAHESVLLALSEECFAGEDGEVLATLFAEIAGVSEDTDLFLATADYAEAFEAAAAPRIVRKQAASDGRVRIYGLLEARLTHADRVILGGLVEGTWPPETRNDAWLNRPMRHQLGLDLPERRIGLVAHDFAQLLGTREVILTHAAKLKGTPTIPSRFIQRLAAVAGARWNDVVHRGDAYLAMARGLEQPGHAPKPADRPTPRPPRSARPSLLSVTEIETWLRDPYSIYAKHVLGLRPLEAIDEPPGARDRGTMIHRAVGEFSETYTDNLPPDVTAALIAYGEKYFAPLRDHPEARAFWWPRFLRVARWFADFEAGRRADVVKLDAEISGKLSIPVGERTFTLRARADRIEHLANGKFALLDYKTGTAPTASQVRSGLAPQLTLEAALLRAGKFPGIAESSSIDQFLYVELRGAEPPGRLKPIAWEDTTPDAQADRALQRLTELVTRFEDEAQPYYSRVTPMFIRRGGGDYDHLARVKEWSIASDGEEESGE